MWSSLCVAMGMTFSVLSSRLRFRGICFTAVGEDNTRVMTEVEDEDTFGNMSKLFLTLLFHFCFNVNFVLPDYRYL